MPIGSIRPPTSTRCTGALRLRTRIAGPGWRRSPAGSTTRAFAGRHAVIACSALKRRYRDVLIGSRADVRLVYLKGDETLIARRFATRHEHFMPQSLLHSQFDALEEPGADENPVVISIEPEPREIVAQILSALRLSGEAVPPEQAAPESTAPGARTDP
jgi:gluconokinase